MPSGAIAASPLSPDPPPACGRLGGLAALGRGPIARASLTSVAIRLSGLALSFVQGVLTARLLGAAGYGTIAFVLALAQIAATLAVFGFGSLAIREIAALKGAGERAESARFVRFAGGVVLLLAGVASLALLAAVGFDGAGDRTVLALAALLVFPLALIALARGVAQGFGRVAAAQLPGEALRPLLMVTALGGAAALGVVVAPSHYMGMALATASLTALAAGVAVRRMLPRQPRGAATSGARRRWLGEALPFLGLALTSMLAGEINTLLLGWLAGPAQAGLFQPIARLTPLLVLAVEAAGMRYAPRVAELWAQGEIARIARISRLFTLTTTGLTLLAGAALLLAGPWLMTVFGSEFRAAAPLLGYVVAAQLFNAACGPVGYLLNMTRESRAALIAQLAGLAVNLALGLWLVPAMGAEGAVIALSAGIVTWNCAMSVMVRRRLGFAPGLVAALLQSRAPRSA